jgi:hypothetical protein
VLSNGKKGENVYLEFKPFIHPVSINPFSILPSLGLDLNPVAGRTLPLGRL